MKKIETRFLQIFFLFITCFLNQLLFSQEKISFRFSGQLDFQNQSFNDVTFPYVFKKHVTTTNNFGIDVLVETNLGGKWKAYSGLGYFRNRFDFQRSYDHNLLNGSIDSIPIGKSTKDYTYSLMRIPVGILYSLSEKKGYSFACGIETFFNFVFKQSYRDNEILAKVNSTYSRFHYYGNSLNFLAQFSKRLNKHSFIEISPFIRVLNISKQNDSILYQNNQKSHLQSFDAFGISLKYSFSSVAGVPTGRHLR